jgi:hypothetical protein
MQRCAGKFGTTHTMMYPCWHAGLWKAWFLPLLKGEHAPSVPKEPPVVHTVDRVIVPYTAEEIADRTRGYEEKKRIHAKTMQVLH